MPSCAVQGFKTDDNSLHCSDALTRGVGEVLSLRVEPFFGGTRTDYADTIAAYSYRELWLLSFSSL